MLMTAVRIGFVKYLALNVVGKGCTRVLEETIKYFTKMLPKAEHKNKI